MKKIKIILTLLVSGFLSAQSGRIIYSNKTFIDPMIEAKSEVKSFVKELYANADKIKFELLFDNKKTFFKYIDDNMNVGNSNDLTSRLLISGENIYCDHINKTELHIDNDNVIIKDNYNTKDWIITNDTKKIDNYNCIKAIYKYDFLNRKGEIKKGIVTAWFAPSLPYSFGPKNYYGLPGLILELTEGSTTYIVTKIELSNKNISVVQPRGKTISREEYNKRLKKQMGY